MLPYYLMAHAGEQHNTQTETTMHFLQEWFIAVPLLLVVVAALAFIVYFISRRSKPITFLSVTGILLVIGVGTYTFSPSMSVVSLSTGLGLLLVVVLASLMKPAKAK